jgi:phosphoribosylanthranilate isomerase
VAVNPSSPDPPADSPGNAERSPARVKVCGLTRVAEALRCAELGVDWIGLNFHLASSRRVSLEDAAAIVAVLPHGCAPVGLFVDRAPEEVRAIAARVGFRIIQLHGDEPPEDLLALADFTIIRAFRLGDASAIVRMASYLSRAEVLGRSPDAILIDAYVPGLAGGTGHAIPPELLEPLPSLPKLILAGGLTPENVAQRVALIHPWMVDVASGVESAPGRKDLEKVAAFVRNARAADATLP